MRKQYRVNECWTAQNFNQIFARFFARNSHANTLNKKATGCRKNNNIFKKCESSLKAYMEKNAVSEQNPTYFTIFALYALAERFLPYFFLSKKCDSFLLFRHFLVLWFAYFTTLFLDIINFFYIFKK